VAWRSGFYVCLVSFLLTVAIGFGELAHAERLHLPLGRNLETDLLDQALKTPPEKLIAFIEAQGVRVHLYPSRRARNPQFKNGTLVAAPLREERGLMHVFEDSSGGGSTISDAGVFIPAEDDDLGRYGPFIAITESATSHTLLHEFTHYLFYRTELAVDRSVKYTLANRTYRSNKYLGLQLAYGLQNSVPSDIRTRDNLVEMLISNIDVEAERVHWFVAEEVLVESILAGKIAAQSPHHFSQERIEKGRAYAKKNIMGARIELAQRLSTWEEVKHSFLRAAGDVRKTSTAERDEIVSRVPEYQSLVSRSAIAIENALNELEPWTRAPSTNRTSK